MIHTSLVLSLQSSMANAAESAHSAHSNEIPTVIIWQFVNLAILFSALIYLLKDSVKKSFADKKTEFLAQAEKSKAAQAEAEKSYLEIKQKLDQFNLSANGSVSRARDEAQELRKQMVSDAKNQAQRLKEEATSSAKNESLRAQRKLHSQVVADVLNMARTVLSKDIGSNDHQKLQSDFSKNIQVVNP